MKILMNRGVRNLFLTDPNFSLSQKHVEKICLEMEKNKISFNSLFCFLHVDFTTKKMLKILKKAGFTKVFFGVESLSSVVLKNIMKSENPENYSKKTLALLEYAKSINLWADVAYIVPLPGQTKETVFQEINLLKKSAPEVSLYFLAPYPGTIFWMQNKNKIKTKDFYHFDEHSPIFQLSSFSYEYYKKVYNLVYPFHFKVKLFLYDLLYRFWS